MIEILKMLHEISRDTPRHVGSYYVRHLDPYESIPQFGHGIPDSPLSQREWVWVAWRTSDDSPVAILIAAPTQGVVTLMRIFAIKGATNVAIGIILRKSLADMYSRGYAGFVAYLDKNRPEEAKLLRIAVRAGAKVVDTPHVMVGGSTDVGKW